MQWIVFFFFSVFVFFITKSYKEWRQLWYAGLFALLVMYAIDTTLIKLGAYSFRHPNLILGGIPTFYWFSSFFGGMVLTRFYPQKTIWKLPYILLSSFLFLLLELIMHFGGYFYYYNWSSVHSFFLDIFGLTVVIWFWSWMNEIRKN